MPSSLLIAFLDDQSHQTLPTCYSVTSVVFECCQNGHRQIKFCVVIRGWPNGVGDDVRVEGGRWTKGDGRRKRLTGLFSLKAPLSLSRSSSLSGRIFFTVLVVVVADLLAAAAATAAVGFPSISRSQRLKLRIRRHS